MMIAPPPKKRAFFFNEHFVAARREEGCHIFTKHVLVLHSIFERSLPGGGKEPPCFRRCDREPVSKPAISLKKSWGGLPQNESCIRPSSFVEQVELYMFYIF